MFGGLLFFQVFTVIIVATVAADTMGEAKSSIFCNISSSIRLICPVHYLVSSVLLLFRFHSNVNHVVEFTNLFPVSLSGVPFDATVGDIDYLLADVTFKYEKYDILDERMRPFE